MAARKQVRSDKKTHWLDVSGEGLPGCKVEVTEGVEDPGYAIGNIKIAGVYMHLECIAVFADGDGVHQAFNETYSSRVETLEMEMDAHFETAQFDGRCWVIIATPHG